MKFKKLICTIFGHNFKPLVEKTGLQMHQCRCGEKHEAYVILPGESVEIKVNLEIPLSPWKKFSDEIPTEEGMYWLYPWPGEDSEKHDFVTLGFVKKEGFEQLTKELGVTHWMKRHRLDIAQNVPRPPEKK